MNDDAWVSGPSPQSGLPARPDQMAPSLPAFPSVAAKPSRSARVAGGIMAGVGAFLTLGAVTLLTGEDTTLPTSVIVVELVLTVAMVAGGVYIFRRGWAQGRPALNVLAVLPAAVMAVLLVAGTIISVAEANAPTDAFGYTEAQRQSFTSGCGGGARCDCLFSAVERQIPPDRFAEEGQKYMQTGSFSPEMTSDLTRIASTAGC